MDNNPDGKGTLPDVVAFFRAMTGTGTRKAAFAKLGRLLRPWAIGGAACSLLLAGSQVAATGVGPALHRFALWWLLVAGFVALLPVGVILASAALELVLYGVFFIPLILLFILPELLFGERRAEWIWGHVRKLSVIAYFGVLGLIVVAVGYDSAVERPADRPREAAASTKQPAAVTGHRARQVVVVRPGNAARAWAWFRSSWLATLFGVVLVKTFDTLWARWTSGERARTVLIYGPDQRVVRKVQVDSEPP